MARRFLTPIELPADPGGPDEAVRKSHLDAEIATRAPAAHSHGMADLIATGTPSATTYLRGDGTWATPAGSGAVDSVNGEVGAVVLDAADVGAQPADADLTAIAGLTPSDGDILQRVAGAWAASPLTKSSVGLGNVDNTSDANKPISTAQQAALDAKAPTSRTISAGTGLTGGGDLTANRTLAVAYGTTAGTAAEGNDARLSDSRVPLQHAASHGAGGTDVITPAAIGAVADNDSRLTNSRTPTAHAASHASNGSDPISPASIGAATAAHNHDASAINAGTLSVDRLPRVTNPIAQGSAASAITSDAAVGGSIRRVTVTGAAVAVGVPTNPTDGQILRYMFFATVATTITFNSAIKLSTGLTSRAFSVPQGQVLIAALEYGAFATSPTFNAWVLTAATVSAN